MIFIVLKNSVIFKYEHNFTSI